jgi:hypothetical protein
MASIQVRVKQQREHLLHTYIRPATQPGAHLWFADISHHSPDETDAVECSVFSSSFFAYYELKAQRHVYTSTMDMVLQLIGSFFEQSKHGHFCPSKAWAKCDVILGCPEYKKKFKPVEQTRPYLSNKRVPTLSDHPTPQARAALLVEQTRPYFGKQTRPYFV